MKPVKAVNMIQQDDIGVYFIVKLKKTAHILVD
jgi:hypothetical protein